MNVIFRRFGRAVMKRTQLPFFRIIRQTFAMLFPFALIGSFAQMIRYAFLSPEGLFYNIAYFDQWVPEWLMQGLQGIFTGISRVTFSLFGILVAYAAAKYTARIYHRDSQIAGATGIIVILLIAFRYNITSGGSAMDFNWRILGAQSLLISLLVGYGVGQIFHWLGAERNFQRTNHVIGVRERSLLAMRPLLASICTGILIALLLNVAWLGKIIHQSYNQMISVGQSDHNLLLTILGVTLITFFDWIGLGSVSYTAMALSGGAYAENLSYALKHGSAWNVPYPFFGGSLYNSFANFGGNGLILALVVAIIIASKKEGQHQMARWTLLPTLFNAGYGALIGLPVIMNPLYLLPILILPGVNLLIAAGAIAVHLIPPTPYPVLMGTPGPLISFVASNGNWWSLIFTLALFAFDVWCFIPFVKVIDRYDEQLNDNDEEVD